MNVTRVPSGPMWETVWQHISRESFQCILGKKEKEHFVIRIRAGTQPEAGGTVGSRRT